MSLVHLTIWGGSACTTPQERYHLLHHFVMKGWRPGIAINVHPIAISIDHPLPAGEIAGRYLLPLQRCPIGQQRFDVSRRYQGSNQPQQRRRQGLISRLGRSNRNPNLPGAMNHQRAVFDLTYLQACVAVVNRPGAHANLPHSSRHIFRSWKPPGNFRIVAMSWISTTGVGFLAETAFSSLRFISISFFRNYNQHQASLRNARSDVHAISCSRRRLAIRHD